MGNYLVTEAQIAAGGSFTSASIDVEKGIAFAVHLQTLTGTAPDITFTYQLSSSSDGVFITGNETIGANVGAVDIMDFAPEAGSYIQIIITNNNGVNTVTPRVVLAIQEQV